MPFLVRQTADEGLAPPPSGRGMAETTSREKLLEQAENCHCLEYH